jgi:hypothetical protein
VLQGLGSDGADQTREATLSLFGCPTCRDVACSGGVEMEKVDDVKFVKMGDE